MAVNSTITAIETDFHQWAEDTAASIRERRMADVDWDSVAEEIEDLAKRERRELQSRLAQLIYHVLKTEFQPEAQTKSWAASIKFQREDIRDLLVEEPSLKRQLDNIEFWTKAYRGALQLAIADSLPEDVQARFPQTIPYGKEILD